MISIVHANLEEEVNLDYSLIVIRELKEVQI